MKTKTVQLYTRNGCHLCEVAETALAQVRRDTPFELEVIDVDRDPALVERYGVEVPVVLVEGEKFAIYRVDQAALRARLQA